MIPLNEAEVILVAGCVCVARDEGFLDPVDEAILSGIFDKLGYGSYDALIKKDIRNMLDRGRE